MEEMQWEKCLKTIFQKYKRIWCQFAWNMWKKELRRFIFIVLFEDGMISSGFFYKVNSKIVKKNKLNDVIVDGQKKYDVSIPRQKGCY